MMQNQLLKKLLIKPGNTLLSVNAPDDVDTVLGTIPTDLSLSIKKGEKYDAALLFARNSKELNSSLAPTIKKLIPDGIFWIIYPKKKSSIPTDLNTMPPWDVLGEHGVELVSSAGIDDTWTALRVRPKGMSKSSGLCLDDIENSDYGKFIDVKNRTVSMPEDLMKAAQKEPSALAYFEQLSFTNKKEYVLWVLTAKQEKTRTTRVEKTVEKLAAGKKNPSEK